MEILSRYPAAPEKKKNKKFLYFLLFFFIFITIIAIYVLYNYEQFQFYFQEDKYTYIEKQYQIIEQQYPLPLDRVKKLEDHLSELIADNPADPKLFFYRGKLYYMIFNLPFKKNNILSDVFFNRFIGKYHFSVHLDKSKWQNAIASFKKALILQLPQVLQKEAHKTLIHLYLLGETSYLNEAYKLTQMLEDESDNFLDIFKSEKLNPSHSLDTISADQKKRSIDLRYSQNISKHLLNIIICKEVPNWKILKKVYNKAQIKFFKAIYFLNLGNRPYGFSLLKEIIKAEDIFDQNIIDNSYYLMGYINKQLKNFRTQLKYYSKIDTQSFLPKNKWFFDEYTYLLRFMGKYKQNQQFVDEYEELYLKSNAP